MKEPYTPACNSLGCTTTQVLFCSLAGGVPFISEGADAAANTEDAPLKSLDIAKRHETPLLLALAGAQVTARAYMALRSSLPKVPPHLRALRPIAMHLHHASGAVYIRRIAVHGSRLLDVSAEVLRGPSDS